MSLAGLLFGVSTLTAAGHDYGPKIQPQPSTTGTAHILQDYEQWTYLWCVRKCWRTSSTLQYYLNWDDFLRRSQEISRQAQINLMWSVNPGEKAWRDGLGSREVLSRWITRVTGRRALLKRHDRGNRAMMRLWHWLKCGGSEEVFAQTDESNMPKNWYWSNTKLPNSHKVTRTRAFTTAHDIAILFSCFDPFNFPWALPMVCRKEYTL